MLAAVAEKVPGKPVPGELRPAAQTPSPDTPAQTPAQPSLGSFIFGQVLLWGPKGGYRASLSSPQYLARILPSLQVWVTCPANHCGWEWGRDTLTGTTEATPGPGWDLGLASPDSCGLLQRRIGVCDQEGPAVSATSTLRCAFSMALQRPLAPGHSRAGQRACGRALVCCTLDRGLAWPWLLEAHLQACGTFCLTNVYPGVLCQSAGTVWLGWGFGSCGQPTGLTELSPDKDSGCQARVASLAGCPKCTVTHQCQEGMLS